MTRLQMRPHFASPAAMNWSIMTCAPLAKSPNWASQITRRIASDVVARDPHAVVGIEQRRIRERFAHSPIERQLSLPHRLPVGDDPLDAGMQLEAFRNLRQALRNRLER